MTRHRNELNINTDIYNQQYLTPYLQRNKPKVPLISSSSSINVPPTKKAPPLQQHNGLIKQRCLLSQTNILKDVNRNLGGGGGGGTRRRMKYG